MLADEIMIVSRKVVGLLPDVVGMCLGIWVLLGCSSRHLIRRSINFSDGIAGKSFSHRVHLWLMMIQSHEEDLDGMGQGYGFLDHKDISQVYQFV